MKIYNSLSELVGKTPLLKLNNYMANNKLKANILAKLEYLNPAGSVKDRVALNMINDAIEKGLLNSDSTIIEPTSGNTGIGLASICASLGYKCIIVMPDTMSIERIKLMKAYGATVVLTDGGRGMTGAINRANELAKEIPNSIVAGQFVNDANPKAHMISTGPEIWDDTDGNIDVFVCGIGTGGTITGVGEYLKAKNPKIKIIGVEPSDSAVLTDGKAGPHKIQGIGAGFIPKILNTDIYDEVMPIKSDDAYFAARELARCEGILVGISSGAALYAAKKLAKNNEYKNKNIVVLLPDTGDRYLSTDLFEI